MYEWAFNKLIRFLLKNKSSFIIGASNFFFYGIIINEQSIITINKDFEQ